MKYKNISPWFSMREQGNTDYKCRWIFFPFAGAAPSALHAVANRLSSDVQVLIVDLPGRGKRMKEPLFDNVHTITEQLLNEFTALPDLPTYFFGYSLGTLIAYELAIALKEKI
ncbi:thioesterase II family protein [Aquimarina agarivorans]|uniref:thioesterase II family protein n=1 Tax=Aquimarina agarivorans TaxID=980584 RepID=UPI000248FD14|nr:alpha/beta fold hydrolase [Aquimarina agarivorans]